MMHGPESKASCHLAAEPLLILSMLCITSRQYMVRTEMHRLWPRAKGRMAVERRLVWLSVWVKDTKKASLGKLDPVQFRESTRRTQIKAYLGRPACQSYPKGAQQIDSRKQLS